MDDRMAVRLEEFEKFLSYFAAFHIWFHRINKWQLLYGRGVVN